MRRTYLLLVSVIAMTALSSACSTRAAGKSENHKDKVSKHILEKVPGRLTAKIGADLDGKVELVGYILKDSEVAPGEKIEITWYWKCNEAPGKGWRIFTHMLDSSGRSKINHDSDGPIRKHFQPEHWTPGMIIEDPQIIKVPETWGSSLVELRLGLFAKSGRMQVSKGPRDKENRVKGARIAVSENKGKPVLIPQAVEKPVIDGSFEDESAWKDALVLDKFYHTLKGTDAATRTSVRVMWDVSNLYVAMTAEDDYLQSKYTEHDDELWHEDAFEIFIDPRGDKRHYFELQINPKGVMFDSYLPGYRKNRNEWSSETVATVTVKGTLNDSKRGDTGWSAEMAIPFNPMNKGGGVPPKSGDKWRVNFFRVDATAVRPRYSAWSPPLRGDFHALDRFGVVEFASLPTDDKQKKEETDGGAGVLKQGSIEDNPSTLEGAESK